MYTRIRDLREDKDLSQQDVADKLYMHKTTYVRYETGKREVPMNIAIMLADFYQVTLDYLVGRTERQNK